MLTSDISREIQELLDKETGPMGSFILKKQCKLLSIPYDNIEHEHLPKVALKLSEALLVFGKEKANRVYMDIKNIGKSNRRHPSSLEEELDMAQAAGIVGNIKDEKEHIGAAEKLGAGIHPRLSGRYHCLTGGLLLREGDLEGSREAYEDALLFFTERGDEEGVADSIYGIGSVLWREGKYQAAKDKLVRCAEICVQSENHIMEGRCLMALGNIHDEWGKFDESISYSEESKKAFETAGDKRGLATLHNNLGVAYARRGLFEESLVEYEKCMSIAEEIGFRMMYGWSMFNAAEDNARLNRFQDALEQCRKSEKVFTELGDRLGISGVHMSYAVSYWLKGDGENASKHFLKTIEMRRELGMPYRLADALYEHGRFLGDVGRNIEAIETFNESLSIFTSLNNPERIAQVKEALDKVV